MSPLSDITSYAFDGSDLEIPFVLNGSGATVWLIIYTEGYEAPFTITGEGPGPYQDPEHAAPGWHVFGGTDVLVYKSAGERFDEGENTIVWNGLDMEGNVVMPGVSINASTIISDHCILNTNSSLDHDCRMANFSSLAPNSAVGGNCSIGQFSYVGIGASIFHGVSIEENCIVGGGSILNKNAIRDSTYYGIPAKRISERKLGDSYL